MRFVTWKRSREEAELELEFELELEMNLEPERMKICEWGEEWRRAGRRKRWWMARRVAAGVRGWRGRGENGARRKSHPGPGAWEAQKRGPRKGTAGGGGNQAPG